MKTAVTVVNRYFPGISRAERSRVVDAVALYARFAPNSHLGDSTEKEDCEYACGVVALEPSIWEGAGRCERLAYSMQDM